MKTMTRFKNQKTKKTLLQRGKRLTSERRRPTMRKMLLT